MDIVSYEIKFICLVIILLHETKFIYVLSFGMVIPLLLLDVLIRNALLMRFLMMMKPLQRVPRIKSPMDLILENHRTLFSR